MARTTNPPDLVFLAMVAGLVAFGFLVLNSASNAVAYGAFGDSYYFVKHQLIFGLIPGVVAMFVASRIPYTRYKRYAFHILLASIGLLILVFIPGIGAEFGTSKSWINFGGVFSLQPAEIVKLTFLIYLAAWLEARGKHGAQHVDTGLIPFLLALGSIMALMILQPDIGGMTIIVLSAFVVYFVGGASLVHLGALGGVGIGLIMLLIKVAPYRAARFTVFLHPELDPQGIGYHINQALLAIGSGGFFGLGYGHSRQKFQYLPEVAGDSIFAVMSEELGFLFAALLVSVFIALLWRGIRISQRAPDHFGEYVTIGIVSWLVIQAFINIGSMIGIMPMTGVTLPFVSYGGTSLTVALAAVGIVMNVSKHSKAEPARG